jgi:hypothetical protein
MRRTTGRAALLVALCVAALPLRAAGDTPPQGKPDLSVAPPERDPVLLLLQKDQDLYARAASGTNMMTGGRGLTILGGLAIPYGLILWMSDVWQAGVDAPPGQPGRPSSRGLYITAGGVAALCGGILLIREGEDRRNGALNAYNARHSAGPPAR